jgi:hypothetical protein
VAGSSPAVVFKPRFSGCPRHKEKPVAIDQVDRTIVRRGRFISVGPGASELTGRVVMLLFGLIQFVIGARFVLLLLDAREANGLVSAILNISQVFVAPFAGILRTDSLHASGSVLDITAIVAFIGWTVLEVGVIAAVRIFRREPA